MIILDNFYQFCTKIYVVTTHMNGLIETVHMMGSFNYHQIGSSYNLEL